MNYVDRGSSRSYAETCGECAARGARRIRLTLFFVLLTLVLVSFACHAPGTHPSGPTVAIQAPATGTIVPVDEPVLISSVATDSNGPGIARVELFVNSESIRVDESVMGVQSVFDIAQLWIPTEEGQATITVVAYRKDGTPSAPASITLVVVGMTPDPSQPPPYATLFPTESVLPSSSPQATEAIVQGRVGIPANIRSGPGPFCPIVGAVQKDIVIGLLELSKDGLWYKTDYLGQDQIGWITRDGITPLGDVGLIPVGNRVGCQGCGDGSCNLDETCDSCPEDCGECCGNALCEPEYGEDCGTCEVDCGPCCGNGICEPGRGEDCESCEADCGPCCGNGLCEGKYGENCSTCPADCGPCCGNGLCEGKYGENCSTCSADCGQCCGNGLCEGKYGEDCATCPTDCGVCPVCGDGVCEPGEDCATCPADCGACP